MSLDEPNGVAGYLLEIGYVAHLCMFAHTQMCIFAISAHLLLMKEKSECLRNSRSSSFFGLRTVCQQGQLTHSDMYVCVCF